MRKKRGSLTVEAIISFTVFLSVSFLLLTVVKLVLVATILNNAATETAKTLASSSYLIALVNDQQEKYEKKADELKPEKLADSLCFAIKNSVVSEILTGGGAGMFSSMGWAKVEDLLQGAAAELAGPLVYDLKGRAANAVAGSIADKCLDQCGLRFDYQRVMLRAVKLPETKAEYAARHAGGIALYDTGAAEANLSQSLWEDLRTGAENLVSKVPGLGAGASGKPAGEGNNSPGASAGLTARAASSHDGTDGDFNAADVLICLEYPYEIALPLLSAFELTLRCTVVEHGWVNGTRYAPPRTEGINLSDLVSQVYVTTSGNGMCYHKKNCFTLKRSKVVMELSALDAIGKNYTPCKVCKP